MLLAHTLAIKLSSVALVFLSSQLQIKMQKADNFLYFKNLKNSVFEILIFGTCDQVKKIGVGGGCPSKYRDLPHHHIKFYGLGTYGRRCIYPINKDTGTINL